MHRSGSRLEPISMVRVLSLKDMAAKLSSLNSADGPEESEYQGVADQLGAMCILSQKFEIVNRDKVIHYYLEATSAQNHHSLAIVERDLPIDNFSPAVDSCLVDLIKKLGVQPGTDLIRFFQIPILSANSHNVKQLGEILLKDRSSENVDKLCTRSRVRESYRKRPDFIIRELLCRHGFP